MKKSFLTFRNNELSKIQVTSIYGGNTTDSGSGSYAGVAGGIIYVTDDDNN